MARPSAEDRRLDYLRIGAELATGFGPDEARIAAVDALADVKVADIADLAGVTKGAVYHVWTSQEEYRKDLLRRLLEHSRQSGIRHMLETLEDPQADPSDPRALLRIYADRVFREMKDDPAFFARLSFFLYSSHSDVAEALIAGEDNVVSDFAPYLQQYLDVVERRMRSPYTIEILLRCANALFQGLSMRYRTSPELIDREIGPDGASPYAFGLDALLERFTEPIEG